jgi:nucleoid DNA-binding protein
MEKKPKVFRWNRWEKDEKKPVYRELTREEKERLKQQKEQPTENQIRHAPKLTRETLAKIISRHLKEDPKLKRLAEEIALKVILKALPEITQLVLSEMVKVIHNAVLSGAKVEIRGLASWKTKKGKVKVKNHIKPKQPNQP